MVDAPLVSVLMPVYNTAQFLAEAIQSILNQTYQNLELIIVNDGSTDNSEEVILSFNDKRIRYYPNAENKKIVYSRNKALELANGKYIAFLDSDDFSVPNRLEAQVDFLEKNVEYGFIGSDVRFINTRKEYSDNIISYQVGDDDIEIVLLFKNQFCASAITFRRDAIGDLRFDPDFPVAEDYDFYIRILEKGWKATNLNQVLTYYRVHSFNITHTASTLLVEKDIEILKRQLAALKFNYTADALRFYFLLGKLDIQQYYDEYNATGFAKAHSFFSNLAIANSNAKKYNQQAFVNYLFKRWWFFFVSIKQYNFTIYNSVLSSPFYSQLSLVTKIKFFLKCVFNKKA